MPTKPQSEAELDKFLEGCHSPTRDERYVQSHNTIPGEEKPRPCTCCTFAHNPATALAEQAEMYAEEASLTAVDTKAGKKKFADWRMEYARRHGNVQPGVYGKPMLQHDFDNQILDSPLHMAKLGIPKTFWKYGILNNASDDARESISNKLKEFGTSLDCRRKDDSRVRADKWFTGEAWASFCSGVGKSPGGPIGIVSLVLIVAEDLRRRGVARGAGVAGSDSAVESSGTVIPYGGRGGGRGGARGGSRSGGGRGRGRASFVARAATALQLHLLERQQPASSLQFRLRSLQRLAPTPNSSHTFQQRWSGRRMQQTLR